MLNATLTEKVQLLKARAGNETSSSPFSRHTQLPQKMLPGLPSQPIWGKSTRGVVVLEDIVAKSPVVEVSPPHGQLQQVDESFHATLQRYQNAVRDQAQIVADVLRHVHEQLLLESQSLVEQSLLQLDDECIADTRNENSGSWYAN